MSYLFISKFYALFLGHYFNNSEHQHHALQLCKGLDSDLELSININNKTVKGKSFLIAPNCPHKVISGKGELFLLFLDPDTIAGKKIIEKYLGQEPCIPFDSPLITESLKKPISSEKIRKSLDNFFQKLNAVQQNPFDPRISQVLDIIDNNPLKKIRVPLLAQEIQLSESRLQHLFKEYVGISIKRYLLWKRIGSALEILQVTNDLTTVAYEAGFSDSAHFSRAFKEMFGVRLKELFKTAGRVQVFYLQ